MTKETISEKQARAMAQVCLDLHDALGCKWGDNPYLAIDRLKTAAPVQEPVAWRFTGIAGFKRFVTDAQYEAFSPEVQSWYEPFKCSGCTTPPAAQHQCKWPTCQSEEYQQALVGQINQEFVAGAAQPAPCTWTKSADPHMPDTYHATCGVVWTFTDGGPAENDVRFCPGCGNKVEEGRP
jgi:hypothetical protein